MTNKALLKSYITRHGETQKLLSNAIGISLSCFNAKLNANRTEFKQSEIDFIKRRYGLSAAETSLIFFATKVSEKDTA